MQSAARAERPRRRTRADVQVFGSLDADDDAGGGHLILRDSRVLGRRAFGPWRAGATIIPDGFGDLAVFLAVCLRLVFQLAGKQLALNLGVERMIPRRQELGQVGAVAIGARLLVGMEEIDEMESVVSRDRCHGNLPTPRNHRGCRPRSAGTPVAKAGAAE